MIKKTLAILSIVFMTASPLAAQENTKNPTKIEDCKVLKQIAHIIMSERQKETPISELIESIRKGNPEYVNTETEDLVFKLIFDAYSQGIAVDKKDQIKFFEKRWEDNCILFLINSKK